MTVRDGKNDQDTQDKVVGEVIDAGCDILIIDLVDRTEPSNIIKMAKQQNIPVIFFNREPVYEDIMQWDKLYYVGGDAAQSGMLQGEIAADVICGDYAADRNSDGKIQYVLLEYLQQFIPRHRVKSAGRLIENKQLRTVRQRYRKI